MKILSNKQYKLFLAQQGKIEQLQKENDKLRKKNKILSRDLRDLQNFCINFAADQKAKAIDFPNSINYQLADYESDFPGENPEDIF